MDYHLRLLSFFFLLLLASSLAVVEGKEEVSTSFPMSNYTIDLDVDPRERWNQVVDEYHDQLLEVVNVLPKMFPEEIRPMIVAKSNWVGEHLEESMGEYGLEMQGIAERLGVSNGAIVLINAIYEVSFAWACTSIVAQAEDGSVLHGRNQDLGNGKGQTNLLRQIVMYVTFTQNGQTLYTGNTFAGYVGLPTGMRPSSWSISLDATVEEYGIKGGIENAVFGLVDGVLLGNAQLITLLVRDTLRDQPTYNGAVQQMGTVPIVAPVYSIMAGAEQGQGVVITRNRTVAWDYWYLEDSKYDWFLVETNYNHWERNPVYDPRREEASSCMNSVGQSNITLTTLYGCLSTPGVFNPLTTYTAVMNPSANTYFSYMRYLSD